VHESESPKWGPQRNEKSLARVMGDLDMSRRAMKLSVTQDSEEAIIVAKKRLQEVIDTKQDVLDAVYRPDVGHISFIWGDSKCGFRHIIERRRALGQNLDRVLSELPRLLVDGEIVQYTDQRGRSKCMITENGLIVRLAMDMDGKAKPWVLTAYEVVVKSR